MRWKFIILSLFWTMPALAAKIAGPIYTHAEREQKEFEHLYAGVNTLVNSGVGTFSTLTVSTLTVSSIQGVSLGKIYQIVLGSTHTATSTTSTSYTNTSLSASITPTATSNRVLVCAFGPLYAASGTGNVFATLSRSTTSLAITSDGFALNNGSAILEQAAMCTIDSPATTTSTTYRVQIKSSAATTAQWGGGPNGVTQTMVLMELAP